MNFADELRDLSPNISDAAVTELCNTYGTSINFASGLKTIARIVKSDRLPQRNPALFEPWRQIYIEMLANVMNGLAIQNAYVTAINHQGAVAAALSEAVALRIQAQNNRLRQQNLTTEDYTKALDDLGFDLRFNLCKNRVEVNGELISDNHLAEINLRMMDRGFMRRSVIADAIMYAATQNSYHPVQDYLRSLQWDGHQNIASLASFFHVEQKQQTLWPVLLRKWLVGSVYKIFRGDQNPMLVLDGPQGCGKSAFVRWLCPIPDYFRESSIEPDDKDCKIDAAGTWIWEVGELGSTTRRADREALKNFLTTDEFTVRASYERNARKYKSMASFIGTINNECGFLDDPTGARRFWIISLEDRQDPIDFMYSTVLKAEQVWAEAYQAYLAGESHTLDRTEITDVQNNNDEYKTISATEEAIKRWFIIDPNDTSAFMPFTEIRSVLEDPVKGNLKGGELDARRIAAALQSLGCISTRQRVAQVALGTSNKILVRGYLGIKPL